MKNIIDMFNYMQDTFKTDIWFKGLEIMKDVKYKSSKKYIVNQFTKLMKIINSNDF